MGKGADAPDTIGAARETGEQAQRLNEAQTAANRPNQSNAWGATNWASTPVWDERSGQYINQWNQTETLNPFMQSSLDSQQNIQAGRSNLAEGMMGRVWDDMSNPMDFSQYGNPVQIGEVRGTDQFQFGGEPMEDFNYEPNEWRQRAEDSAYQRSTSRLDPQFQAREQELMTKLRNQGLQQGDQAYDAAVANFERGRGDAYEQARLGSTMEGRAEDSQFFGQQLQGYQTNLGARGQDFSEQATSNQMNNALQGQEFNQATQQNQMSNQLRMQQMQEDLFKRGYSLDEVNRMLAGQQISGGPPSTGGQTETLVGNALQGGQL